jgi:hypothetical protein
MAMHVGWLPRGLLIVATSVVVFAAAPALAGEGNLPTIEIRLSPPFVRPYHAPGIGALLALPLTEHWWAGGGYELMQDYNAILWTAKDSGHKPIVMSGIRAGAWYRGGAARRGFSWSAGGLLTFANSVIPLAKSPAQLDGDTYIVDLGADLTVGHVWDGFRVEGFAIPAWSYGHISSTAIAKDDHYSAFTYRIGVALAILLGS